MDAEIEQIKTEHFEALRGRKVILIVKTDYGWEIETWSPEGVAPTSAYDTPQEAGARALQLLGLKEPVTPQSWPETAQIGSGGGAPPKPPSAAL